MIATICSSADCDKICDGCDDDTLDEWCRVQKRDDVMNFQKAIASRSLVISASASNHVPYFQPRGKRDGSSLLTAMVDG